MMPLLRAEFRKLFTVRSTYILSLLAALLVGGVSFYVDGFKTIGTDTFWLSNAFSNGSNIISMFVGIVGILLMGHEYRHNTIMYTLTSANSRSKVLLAKIVAITTYSVLSVAAATLLAILARQLGVALSSTAEFSPMYLLWKDVWQAVFLVVGYGLIGLLLAFLFRHVVGAITALFVIPTVEGVLTSFLKDNAQYLPFTLLAQVHSHAFMSAGKAALLFAGYLAAAWLVAWQLFLRRDAN